MATTVTVESVNDGLYTVKIKREFDFNPDTREFTKVALNDYVNGLELYCKQKGYQFIFNDNGLLDKRGGRREGAGRKSTGTTKRLSINLADETWEQVEEKKAAWGTSQSQTIRKIIEEYFKRSCST